MADVTVADVVQITDETHPWYPSLLIVQEVRSWGVIAYAVVPKGNSVARSTSLAYIRIDRNCFEVVGMAKLVEMP